MSEAPERIWAFHYECEDEPDAIAIGYAESLFGSHEYVRADMHTAAMERAYIAGLDAADTTTNAFMGQLSSSVPAIEHTDIDALIIAADRIRALKDPAHVRAAVANITEGEG